MDDEQFRQLLDHFGYSWSGYRRVRKGVKRRISRHMQQVRCRKAQEYLNRLDADSGLRRQFDSVMSLSVSRFFRDRLLWKIMEDYIVPEIVKENRGKVRFLSVGCACGEEVYSLKIVWEIQRARLEDMPELEILAMDINPDYIRRAREGKYSKSSLKEVPDELRDVYFLYSGKDDFYKIEPSMRAGISWKVQNAVNEPLQGNFQVIFLRNGILTYYTDELRRTAFRKILGSLSKGGFLVIGSHERLPIETGDLLPIMGQQYIFFKRIGS
jgi:chemotaxis protein methyltransferase CheR